MSNSLHRRIEPLRLADRGETITGRVAIEWLPRLTEQLESHCGQASVELTFQRMDQGQRVVIGQVKTEVAVICQRCMQPLQIGIDRDIRLELTTDGRESNDLPKEFEPYEVSPDPISLLEMIEDEILLALPLAPVHSNLDCAPLVKSLSPKPLVSKRRPFDALAALRPVSRKTTPN